MSYRSIKVILIFLCLGVIFLFETKSGRFFLLKHIQKTAIIYIATGNYITFWDEFYNSCEKNFLPNVKKHYFLVTNHSVDTLPANVTHIYYPHKKWPSIVVEKFAIIHSLKEKLEGYDYTYSFNANAWFIQPVKGDVLPNSRQKLIAGLHPNYYRPLFAWKYEYPYESNRNSWAYLEQTKNSNYYQACFIGGITHEVIKMAETIKTWTNNDLKQNFIPIWHDESYYNKYMANKNPLILTPDYLWGSWPNFESVKFFSGRVKIVMREKQKTNSAGMDYYRNTEFLNPKREAFKGYAYLSYQNGSIEYANIDKDTFFIKSNQLNGKLTKNGKIYKFHYTDQTEKCFKNIKNSLFFYEIKCPQE